MPLVDVPLPLLVIVGPTAVGKTEFSIRLAERLHGEIVSADSRLFYRRMDIGTAKPSPEDRARVPHHLIDVADPDETWSLALFQRMAYQVIAAIHAREKLPLLVGGTGQYIRAIIEGWNLPKQPPDLRLRNVLEKWSKSIGPFELHRRLTIIDPEAAGKIDPRNLRRTVRALEVIFRTGKRFAEQRQRVASNYSVLMVGLRRPRAELYRRIDERIDQMIADGLVGEVQTLLASGYSPDLPAFSAIGYRQIIQYLHGKCSLEEAVSEMKRSTRQFVRRQANWFKYNDPSIHWFDIQDDTLERVEALVRNHQAWRRQ